MGSRWNVSRIDLTQQTMRGPSNDDEPRGRDCGKEPRLPRQGKDTVNASPIISTTGDLDVPTMLTVL